MTGTVDQSLSYSTLVRHLLENQEETRSKSRILQYEVVEVIGRGSMGIVVKAFDPGLARHVAIKLLTPEMAGSETAQQRFALEARSAAAIRHENVVAIFAVSQFDGVPVLVMEYVHGSSLQECLDDRRNFTTSEIARIGRQTALGLGAAHDLHLVHRDVKPGNILLEAKKGSGVEKTDSLTFSTPDPFFARVCVTDFGLVRAMDQDFRLSQQGLLIGTPNFMSPEQVDGKPLTPASDLFSLGSVLYTLCTGQLPFVTETMSGLLHAIAEKNPTPIREVNPSVPEGLVRVIEKMQAKDPAERLLSAAAVAEALKPW